uniref:Uncharacterized protein n=1 Tax=Cannabis sativa TaxID=3483 RepID=A0A803Q8U4_CANSA
MTQKFTKEEVKEALFDVPGNKAPGPDGFSGFFYQDNWDLVGEDLFEAVTSYLETGLYPNATKLAIYSSNMPDDHLRKLVQIYGFTSMSLPFTFLGVPIGAKKILGKDCEVLAEKMIGRIKTWSTRNRSFAGRVVLINSVLMAIHAYWCQVVILPKKVVNTIETICRNYLWNGKAIYQGLGAISWESICQPKSVGGIGFKNVAAWNRVHMGKDQLKETSGGALMQQKYTVSQGYSLLKPAGTKLHWPKQMPTDCEDLAELENYSYFSLQSH